jgi:hypothetical protein
MISLNRGKVRLKLVSLREGAGANLETLKRSKQAGYKGGLSKGLHRRQNLGHTWRLRLYT